MPKDVAGIRGDDTVHRWVQPRDGWKAQLASRSCVTSATEILVAVHLPIVLWFFIAYPYMGGTIRSHERRMDFVRFTGEWFCAAALGLNLVLLVNLAGTAWLLVRFLRGRIAFHPLERWQTSYHPVFALWTLMVVVVLPPLFGFI